MSQGLATTLEELLDTFQQMEDWEERYEYIIDLGDQLAPLPEEFRSAEYKVAGCLSTVWLAAEVRTRDEGKTIDLLADSDSLIVKGLVALMVAIYTGRTPREILSVEISTLFEQLGLRQHLSGTRRNGLASMVKRIRAIAAANLV